MEGINAAAVNPTDAGHVNFLTQLDGELIGRLPFERQAAEVKEFTPTPLRNISQHRIEPVLAESLRAVGVDIGYGMQWEAGREIGDVVVSTVRDFEADEVLEMRSRFVIAADGASSCVRSSFGIDMEGPSSLQHFIAIHVRTDLRPFVGDRPGILHSVMDPAAGVFVAHDLDRESVFMVGYDPDREQLEDYDLNRCEAIVRTAIGPGGIGHPLKVVGVGSWNMSAQVARTMRAGRILLVGDAAHRFPPTGGLGLNTGVADAQAVIWRIAAIEAGWAGWELLRSYEEERRPVALVNFEQSMTNAMKMMLLTEALNLVESPTPARLRERLADPGHRPAIDAAVAAQQTHFDMLELQLGYRYERGALCVEQERQALQVDPRWFAPSAMVGERLPHGWLSGGGSTLDLIDVGALTLLTVGAHDRWADALDGVGVPVLHVRLGIQIDPHSAWFDICGFSQSEGVPGPARPAHRMAKQ